MARSNTYNNNYYYYYCECNKQKKVQNQNVANLLRPESLAFRRCPSQRLSCPKIYKKKNHTSLYYLLHKPNKKVKPSQHQQVKATRVYILPLWAIFE